MSALCGEEERINGASVSLSKVSINFWGRFRLPVSNGVVSALMRVQGTKGTQRRERFILPREFQRAYWRRCSAGS